MDFFNFLELLGGLALFLYGMTVMGQGLEKTSGGKLEKILEKFTSNPIKGILLGTAVTAVIQSSSATTVMVVGFVNSGIMRLSQAIGVIMGANVGTTVTAWILSLTGLQGDNFLIELLKPANFSLIFGIIGAVLYIFIKSEKKATIGQILLGFTVLIYGMHMMSESVSPLSENEAFASVLLLFKNPILGVMLGAMVTGIIQSSSASVGILQALSLTTLIPFAAAFPIILGQNIGTCVTAMLSSIGTSKNARRAALVHLYFNIIGTIVFLTLVYTLNYFISFSFWSDNVTAVSIAITHSTFNIFCTLLFLPFTKMLEKLAYLTIKDDEADTLNTIDSTTQILDPRFLQSPSFALEQCKTAILKMGEIAKINIITSFDLMWNYNQKNADLVTANEEKIDILEDRISDYLVKLTDKDLSFQESKNVSKYLHSVSDFERIGDHAENIMEIALDMSKSGMKISHHAKAELDVMFAAVKDILGMTLKSFSDDDEIMAENIEPLEEVIDRMRDTLKARHVERLKEGDCTVEAGVAFNDLLTNLERISDHCSNLALYVIDLKDNKDNMLKSHRYAHDIRNIQNKTFMMKYDEYESKYFSLL